MPLSSGSVQMARGRDTSVSDDFNRPASSPIGETHFGDSPWKNIGGGAWTTDGNGHAVASGSPGATPPPIVVIPTDFSDIDLSATISGVGGDALYFRVQDVNNWWRLRYVETTTSAVTGCQTCSGTSCNSCPDYGCSSCGCTSNCENPGTWCCSGSSSCNSCPSCQQCACAGPGGLGNNPYPCSGCAQGGVGASAYTCTCNCSTYYYSCNCTTTYYYSYYLYLEKCVAGSITTVASNTLVNQATSATAPGVSLGVQAVGNVITPYYNGATIGSPVTDSQFQFATMHGVGRGPTGNDGSALSRFSLAWL